MTRAGLARAAGLHANTLRDCTEPDWNPTAETLGKLERFLFTNDDRPVLVPIEEIIDEARNGRMFVLVDDEDRENEGDLVIPAQMATPAAINFMATHGRGLICLTLTSERCEQLGLDLMSRHNGTGTKPHSPCRSRRAKASPPAFPPATAPAPSASPSTAAKSQGRHRHARPRLPAARPRRRRAGTRRAYRSGGRHLAPCRAQPLGRDLRDHAR
jgi:hypothetical protein